MSEEATIRMRCSRCPNTGERERKAYDPPSAVLIELVCPSCDPNPWKAITYFDKEGNRVLIPVDDSSPNDL